MAEVCVNQLGRTVIVSAEKYSGQTGFVSGQRKQQLQQIIKKYHKTTKSGGKLAAWSRNDANYTLYTPAAVDTEELLSLCRELIEKN